MQKLDVSWQASDLWLYQTYIYIEYEYQTTGVGGFYIPIDKIGLLAPYLALVATVIFAVSISVGYIKYRKKQQTSSFPFLC